MVFSKKRFLIPLAVLLISLRAVLFGLICFAVISPFLQHVPHEGVWVCDDPYVRLDASNNRIEIEENGVINEYHIAWGDEINFEIGILEEDGIRVLYGGSIKLYGDKVHIKAVSRDIDFWLLPEK